MDGDFLKDIFDGIKFIFWGMVLVIVVLLLVIIWLVVTR